MTLALLARVGLAAVAALMSSVAQAQAAAPAPASAPAPAQPPLPQAQTGAVTSPKIEVVPLAPAAEVNSAAAQSIAKAFVQGCVLTEGELTGATDWALSAGYEPRDAGAPEAQTLLDGQAGSVFALPDPTFKLYLVVMSGGRCTVWAEGAVGPAVQQEFQKAMGELSAKGARVQKSGERTIERAGAWRQQLQLRYRRVGGSQDLGLNVVTTVDDRPGVQALHLARVSAAPTHEPDGQPAAR
ncbi:NMCC_0638 family (lipo)protein [Caldimonas brevitalea]|uniref:Lipoprotein n=1 Tax=Caldimonas brevitalea TaxID=413882 RepID=A0A0G3BLY8_9BURK|nr:hypothetical protein [Caldimonas brevitalea]AKJ28371.1 hypothetical protein AAW51_1680 [Caldimonas brevitalea]